MCEVSEVRVEGTDDTNSQSHDGWKEKLVRSVSTNHDIRMRGHDDVFSLIYPRHCGIFDRGASL
jgi:hypothetical protein